MNADIIIGSLVEDEKDFLLDLNIYLPLFLKSLWEKPKTVAKLLLNSDPKDVKEVLSPFFCHNFYQNILSPYTVEESLLSIICLMLKEEINHHLDSFEQMSNFLKI